MQSFNQSIKGLHALSSTDGDPQALSRALRRLRVDSWFLLVSQNYLAYKADSRRESLINVYHPLLSEYPKRLSRVEHPLKYNRIVAWEY